MRLREILPGKREKNLFSEIPSEVERESIGVMLYEERIKLKYSLSDISKILKIKAKYLKAIEKMDLKNLPHRVYLYGFVRAYAEYLGLNSLDIANDYTLEVLGRQKRKDLQFLSPLSEANIPKFFIIIFSLSLSVIVYLVWHWTSNSYLATSSLGVNYDDKAIGIQNNIDVVDKVIEKPLVSNYQENLDLKTVNNDIIMIKATEKSWVEVKSKEGQSLIRKNLDAGEEFEVSSKDGLIFTTGNAGGITISLGNKSIFVLGNKGQVIRDVLLTYDNLALIKN